MKQLVTYLIIKDAEVSVQTKEKPLKPLKGYVPDTDYESDLVYYNNLLSQWLSEAVKVENVDWLLSFMVGKILIQHGGVPADQIVPAPSNLWMEVKPYKIVQLNNSIENGKVAICSFEEKEVEKEKTFTLEEVEQICMDWMIHLQKTKLPDGPVRFYWRDWMKTLTTK